MFLSVFVFFTVMWIGGVWYLVFLGMGVFCSFVPVVMRLAWGFGEAFPYYLLV